MVYDLRNLQTNYMPVLGPNIPFLDEKSSGTDGDLLPQEDFPYKSDVGIRRLQILVSLWLFGTESN